MPWLRFSRGEQEERGWKRREREVLEEGSQGRAGPVMRSIARARNGTMGLDFSKNATGLTEGIMSVGIY